MTIKIDKNVPAKKPKYPFSSMGVGDSFYMSTDNVARLRGNAAMWGTRHGVRFSIRVEKRGARVWRVE